MIFLHRENVLSKIKIELSGEERVILKLLKPRSMSSESWYAEVLPELAKIKRKEKIKELINK